MTQEPPTGIIPVHDLVGLALPVDAAIRSFSGHVTSRLVAQLVINCWRSQVDEAGRSIPELARRGQFQIHAEIGQPRSRIDAVIFPVCWWPISGEWIPPLEADLEIASFGLGRTHLHLLGQSRLPETQIDLSSEASISQRLAIPLVRRVLVALAEEIHRSSRPEISGRRATSA